MVFRQALTRVAVVGVLAVLAFLAFSTSTEAPRAEAVPIQPDCTFAVPLSDLISQGGGADSVTCTFSIRGQEHTLVVDFTLDLTARPPLSIDGCQLDSEPLHIGPCP